MAPGKRKRNDRSSVDSGESRPSPHRPQNASLAQHDRGSEMRDGGRRSSRGGQGGSGGGRGRRNDGRDNPNKPNIAGTGRATPTPGPMSPPPRPSSAAPTPTQTLTPTAELPSPIPKPDPAPFDYSFLTDDRIASWDTGRQEVIALGTQAREDEDSMDLASVFQELIRATMDGRIDPTDAGSCVKEILGPDSSQVEGSTALFDPQTFFVDTLSMIFEAEEGTISQSLRTFAVATGVSPLVMRQKLDGKLLQDLGLTRETFTRVGVRQATNLLYRQANYNLLREETEGYSKLVTELFTTSGSEPPSSEVVEDTFERVKGLIGTFDLDVGRVLDITLDVFAAVLIKHFRFFIKLLRVSSWWPRTGEIEGVAAVRCGGLPNWALPTSPGWMPTEEDDEKSRLLRTRRDTLFWERAREIGLDAFFELGGRQIVDDETKKRILGGKETGDADLDADRQWIKETGTFPPSGNRVAAQLLGFKLRFYTSAARDKDDMLPANLIYLTALLIKIGFISLRDLYPHLWPLDEDMPAVRETKMKELEEKERLNRPGGGAANALMMAGALSDDTLPNGGRTRETATSKSDSTAKVTAEIEDKDDLDEPTDQKVQLLTCLLTIGAIPEALFILGRFPWLPEAYPELVDLINRLLHHSIKDVYDKVRPVATENSDCPTKNIPEADQSGVPKGQVRLSPLPARKQLRWPFPDKSDTNENLSYRFYWDEWADNVPVCQTVDDLFTLCSTLLNYAGVSIGKDASLLSKLARIGYQNLRDDQSQQNLDRWQDLLKRLIVPALSLTKSNTLIANEIFAMLNFYPAAVRYSIYAEWFEGQTSRLPAMKIAFARAKLETLSTMKRISMTNLTAMARNLAKIAYSSPGIVYAIALSQIEAYTNLTEVVVECAKYFTDLGYDVLVWSLMSSLGGKDRNRTNAEFALLPSRWLLALSRFSGKVFKRYGIMNLSPIIRYVSDQLYRGNSTDLVILKELIAQMSGIVPDTDFTDAQLVAMTGGELLRRQTLINLQDKRYESTKTATRLMKALTDTKLAGELLISIAQHRQAAIYKIPDEDAHIKLLATMIDDTQLVLFQYLDLLRSNLSVEEFDVHVPGIPELLTDFGLEPALAFMIGRASLAYYRSKLPSPVLNGTTKALPELNESALTTIDSEGDVGMDGGDTGVQTNGDKTAIQPTLVNGANTEDTDMADIKEGTPPSNLDTDPFQEILEPIIATVQAALPEGSFKALNPDFYVTFWISTLGDLAVPNLSYDTEISRLMAMQTDVMKDRSDMSRSGMARKEETKKAISMTREALLLEFRKYVAGFTRKKARLLKNKGLWFGSSVKADDASEAVLEKCLIPRLLLSPSDADFCFKMVRFLHDNGVPFFRTLSLYAHLFRPYRLRALIFTCTVREAENLGRFLRLALTDFARWHADVTVYEKEAWGTQTNLPGFAKALDENGTPKGFVNHDGDKGFKSILFHWHKALNSALRDCLEGTEWMHIRNAITVLKSVVEVFPAIDFQGNGLIKQLETVAKREKGVREDLSLTGNAVLVQLKKRSKKWVMVQAFGHTFIEAGQPNGGQINGKLPSNVSTAKSLLKPTAPEFRPSSRSSSLGVSTPKALATNEVEDGEVDDAKASTLATTNSSSKPPVTRDSTETKRTASPAAPESRKSDILDKRDKIKRENAAKAAAPSPLHSTVPQRPDPLRNSTPNLPSRPDAPFPSRDLLDRHPSRHGDRRDGRESRILDPRGQDRPTNRLGDRLREFPSNDRRPMEPNSRDFGRSSDRLGVDRERVRPDPPPRWTAESARENAERATIARGADSGRLSRDMPPPRASGTLSDRGTPINLDRLPLASQERQDIINPERAALISGDKDTVRSDSPRRGREETRDRVSSRPQSPRRHGPDKEHLDPRRDDRTPRTGPDMYNSPRSRIDDVQPPPAGPRGDRPMERDRASGNDRSTFQSTQSIPRPIDPDHGRLNSVPRPQPDPNFGRLNPAPPTPDIPSGPRDRNSRGGRMGGNGPPPRRDGRAAGDIPRPPTPEKQPPTGPSGRHPRRSASGQFDPASTSGGSTPAPSTPVATSTASAIHPDRLKHLGGSVAQPPSQSTPANQVAAAPIHPDRLKAFGSEPIANPQSPTHTNNSRSRPPVPPLATSGPPSGPKGSQPSPVAPSQNGFAAPTGPASATERAARGGRRQLAGINTMLQQAGQQERPNVRSSRGTRMSSGMGPETPNSAPSTPSLSVPPPPPGPPPGRPEAAGRDMINPERADLITGPTVSTEERERDRSGRRERSGRSRRSSRSPGRDRDAKRGAPEDDRALRSEYRDRSDRRAGERGESEKERHGRSPARDLIPGREPAASGRESGRERERDGSRREGRERDVVTRDPHEAGWIGERGGDRGPERGGGGRSRDMRGGDLRSEERRDSRSTREDGGRKRRSDEGGLDSRGHEKRPRR